MDFASYAERAVDLANLEPYGDPSDDTLVAFVAESFPSHDAVLSPDDLAALRACAAEFREVLLADSVTSAVEGMNTVMVRHPICPEISDHPHPGEGRRWHLHLVAGDRAGDQMAGSMAMGLMTALLDVGLDRRGSCSHGSCEDVYLDASPGGTRRYCSDGCQNRANVAAYRERKRAERAAAERDGDG